MTSALAEQFTNALIEIGGACTVVATTAEAADVIRRLLPASSHIGLSDAPLARELATQLAEYELSIDGDPYTLDAGITGSQWGIAETGTLVLDSSRERNRLLSLVPPIHIALLQAQDLRPTCAAVLAEVARALGSAITFITGPSRTSDIELIPVIGVHGPQHLHVIILP